MTKYDIWLSTDPREKELEQDEENYQEWIKNEDLVSLQRAIQLPEQELIDICKENNVNYSDDERVYELIIDEYDENLREHWRNCVL